MLFYLNPNTLEKYSYSDLEEWLNSSSYFITNYKGPLTGLLFINIVKTLINNLDLVLIDNNVSNHEALALLGEPYEENQVKPIISAPITVENLTEILLKSKSKITLFTSGTMGQPKMISHTVSHLLKDVRKSESHAKNTWALCYNPTHIAGLQVFFQALLNLNPIIDLYNLSKKEIFDAIETYNISNISATPTFFRLLLPGNNKYQSVNRITLGGERSTPSLHRDLNELFPNAQIRNIYAMTESGALLTSQGEAFIIPSSRTKEIKIVNDQILVHRSLIGSDIEDEWYETGDIIEWIDSDQQQFRIISRLNELINVGGMKVNPSEVEDTLNRMPSIRMSYVYSVPNRVTGNLLHAKIVLNPNAEWDEDKVRSELREILQPHKIPRLYHLVDEIPLTRTGKTQRKQ